MYFQKIFSEFLSQFSLLWADAECSEMVRATSTAGAWAPRSGFLNSPTKLYPDPSAHRPRAKRYFFCNSQYPDEHRELVLCKPRNRGGVQVFGFFVVHTSQWLKTDSRKRSRLVVERRHLFVEINRPRVRTASEDTFQWRGISYLTEKTINHIHISGKEFEKHLLDKSRWLRPRLKILENQQQGVSDPDGCY